MEQFLDQLGALFSGFLSLADSGFDGVNQVLGLIIALVAALVMSHWRGIWATAAGATVVHVLIGMLRPVLDGAAFALPDILSVGFWMTALALFLGYVIVIGLFFFVKTVLTGTAFRRHHHAH